jgi:GNAT superfamily N-acetyltransferase
MIDARYYEAKETLRDGRVITIRAVRPEDSRGFADAIAALRRETIYTRIFAHKERLTDEELRRLTAVDFDREVALVATCAAQDADAIIAGGRYVVCDAAGRQAEMAFTVRDDFQGLGIAGRLLEHLVRIARDQGIAELIADVLPQNTAMLRVFARSGLPMTQSRADGVVHVKLALTQPSI